MLLNPCKDEPDQHLQFDQARVVPLSQRGIQTRDILGLNRDELFDRRRELLEKIDFIRHSVEDYNRDGDELMAQQGQTLLIKAASAEAEYTAIESLEKTWCSFHTNLNNRKITPQKLHLMLKFGYMSSIFG